MVSFTLSTLTLGLAAVSSARPATDSKPYHLSPNELTLTLIAEGYPSLSINVIESGVLGNLDLVFERQFAYSGTPVYLNNTMLEFDASNYKYINASKTFLFGMHFQSVGDNYGYTTPVTAIFENAEATKGFAIAKDGSLQPPLEAALESFFVCNKLLRGKEQLALKFGVYNANWTASEGCMAAKLAQNF